MRDCEKADVRQKDRLELAEILNRSGEKFGFQIEPVEEGLAWKDKQGEIRYRYFLLTNSAISRWLLDESLLPKARKVLLLPGSRARWLLYRIRQDPRLEAALEGRWFIVKYRHLRWLAAREWITPESWEQMLNDDPLQWDASPQMQML